MKNRPLIIGEAERGRIATAMAKARQKPKPMAVAAATHVDIPDGGDLTLDKREPDFKAGTWSRFVELPIGYWCAISFEEQPAGLCKHLSISVMGPDHRPVQGSLPSPHAGGTIANAFGIAESAIVSHWVEEYEPGCHAINLVALDKSN